MERGIKIFFDGGCRPNPGTVEAAVVVRGVAHHWADLGQGDNNDAEWLALIQAATLARSFGERDVVMVGDSALVIAQARRLQPCRSPRLAAHRDAFGAIAAGFERLRFRHVARSHNLAGIALERIRSGLGQRVAVVPTEVGTHGYGAFEERSTESMGPGLSPGRRRQADQAAVVAVARCGSFQPGRGKWQV